MIDVLVCLPANYNDGTKVEDEKFAETIEELTERFGGGTIYENVRGNWYFEGKRFVDEMKIVEITVPETPEAKEWFRAYT